MAYYERVIIDLIESTNRNIKALPINLGGLSGTNGGVGAPPGGYIQWLPQVRVAYDETEAAFSGITISGPTLLDNLNHIRYRLAVLESGGSIIVTDDNNALSYLDTTEIHFSGAGVTVTDLGGGEVRVAISAVGSGLDIGAGDARYLKLDASNDPVTNQLDIINNNNGNGGIYVQTIGDALTADIEQFTVGDNVTSPAITVVRSSSGAGNITTAGALDIWTEDSGAGSVTAPLMRHRHEGTDTFRIEVGPGLGSDFKMLEVSSTPSTPATNNWKLYFRPSGLHILDDLGAETKLIGEAPINGLSYERKDAGWVVASGAGGNFLLLDTSNDPLTGELRIIPTPSGTHGLYIETLGDAKGIDLQQYVVDSDLTNPSLTLFQSSTGAGDLAAPLIEGARDNDGTGLITSDLILITSDAAEKFKVDKDGNVYAATKRLYPHQMPDFIQGFEMVWDATNRVLVSKGSCYIPSLGYVQDFDQELTVTASLSANTWYYVYAYMNGSTPTGEFSTTAPVIYHGWARYKNGENNKRYIGAVLTNASGHIYKFSHDAQANKIHYLDQQDGSPFRVLSNGSATTETTVTITSVVPPGTHFIYFHATNTNSTFLLVFGNSIDNVSLPSGYVVAIGNGKDAYVEFPTDTTPAFTYALQGSGGGAYVDVFGYTYKR